MLNYLKLIYNNSISYDYIEKNKKMTVSDFKQL